MPKEAQSRKTQKEYLWGFSREQQEKIKQFSELTEIVEIYKTDILNVEMRIKIPKRKSLKSIWIKENGSDYEENSFNTFGRTIEQSKLTLDEYKEKFPFENIGFAPLSIPGTSIGNLEIDFPKKETTIDKKHRAAVLKVLKNENGLTENEIAKRAGLTNNDVLTVAMQLNDSNAEYHIDINEKNEYFLHQFGAIFVTPVMNKPKGNVEIESNPQSRDFFDVTNSLNVIEALQKQNGLSEKELAQEVLLTVDELQEVIDQINKAANDTILKGKHHDKDVFGVEVDEETKTCILIYKNKAEKQQNSSENDKSDVEIGGVPEKSEYQFANVSRIKPSPTNPRRRFDETSLDELAANIEENGLINPITVRRALIAESDRFDFEIVAGERRWRASQRTSHKTIPVIVKELTDEQVLEIQIHENLHREEVHPLDEAFAYEHLMKTLKITQEELALRVGKPEKFVRMRLKLNQLIPDAQEDLEANRITIKMALEIAKFDKEVQPKVLECAFDKFWKDGKYNPDKESRRTFNDFLDEIKEDVLLELSSARFSMTDKRLRADGLACVNCPERTGAKNSLFDDYAEADDDDRCLNQSCFDAKTKKHTVIFYEDANTKFISENGLEDEFRLAILTWMPQQKVFLETLFERPVLADQDYRWAHTKRCDQTQEGIFLDDSRKFGEIITLCANKTCKTHWTSSFASNDSVKTESEDIKAKKERLERKQYLLDVRVGEPTRVEVLKLAAKQFSIYNADSETVRTNGEYFAESLVRWLKLQNSRNEMTAKVIADIIREWCGDIPKISTYDFDFEKWLNFFNQQREKVLAGVYFLLVHGHKGEMFYETKNDQSEIIAIAEKYNVDYELVYAQNLVKKCAEDKQYKKFSDAAKVYLQAIERGEKIDRPVFFKLD